MVAWAAGSGYVHIQLLLQCLACFFFNVLITVEDKHAFSVGWQLIREGVVSVCIPHSIMTLQMLIKLTETLAAQSQYISHTDANIFNAASASQWRALLVHRVLCIHSPCLDWRSLIPSVRSWELRNCKVSRHLVYC